jgi:outer membrane protein assembly factor BamB
VTAILLCGASPRHAPRPGPEYVPAALWCRRANAARVERVSGLWALDPPPDGTLWHLPLPEGGITAPVALAGALLVGTTRYGAFLLSPRDGRPSTGSTSGSGFSQTPAAFGNRRLSAQQRGDAAQVGAGRASDDVQAGP